MASFHAQETGARRVVPSRAGAMTAAMRAVPIARGEDRLRVAWVRDGGVLEERFHDRDVVIGRDAFATIPVDAVDEARLFTRERGDFSLRVPHGCTARVSLDGAVRTLAGDETMALPRGACGKVTLGETVLLFQVIAAPPKGMRAQLPLGAVRSSPIDFRFAVLAALSFLVHFGVASAVHSDFLDPIVDDDALTASLITESRARPHVETEEKPKVATDEAKTPPDDKTKVATNDAAPHNQGTAATNGGHTSASPAKKGVDLNALGAELDNLGLSAIASVTNGPATKKVTTTSAPDAALDEVAKKHAGVEVDGNPLKDPGGNSGPIGPPPGGKPSFDPSETKTKVAKVDAPSGAPLPPVSDPTIIPPQGNAPKDVNAVIARGRWRLKACYAQAIAKDSTVAGTVRVRVELGGDGHVLSAQGAGPVPQPLVSCVEATFRSMKFAEPGDASTTFSVPVVFAQSK